MAKGKVKDAAVATASTILSNPEKLNKAGEFLSGAIDQGPPPMTLAGGAGYVAGKIGEKALEGFEDFKRHKTGR